MRTTKQLPTSRFRFGETFRKGTLIGLILTGSGAAFAATATWDFTTDPKTLATNPIQIFQGGFADSTGESVYWKAAGGTPGGFLGITWPLGGSWTIATFPDIDNGALVAGFKFEADVRVGNPQQNERAADGFSVSFARSNDPVFTTDPPTQGNFASGIAEAGTTTGIAVSFDTWSGNGLPDGPDIEGIIVRVDNVTVHREAVPTRNGACDDTTSLQTGPRDLPYWEEALNAGTLPDAAFDPASWVGLCWKPLVVEVDTGGKLTVIYKGRTILNQFQTTYFPSAGGLVLAGRTGGADEHTHFDNVKITTTPTSEPLIGQPAGSSCGFVIPIADSGTVSPNQSTITVKLNGTAVTPSITRQAPNTLLAIDTPTFFPVGSTQNVEVAFTSSSGAPVSAVRQFVVPSSITIPASAKVAGVTATSSGFKVRVHQIDVTRGPLDPNWIVNAERQIAGLLVDDAGQPLPNVADGTEMETVWINWNEAAPTAIGNFTSAGTPPREDEPILGISASTDNIGAEFITCLELKRGCYTLGVNSDDGFVVTLGHGAHGTVLGSFNGGRGSADTTFRVVVDEDGFYPIRLSWWEGGGGANVEFFSVTPTGEKILINDRENPNAIKAYSECNAPATLKSVGPTAQTTGVPANAKIVATFMDDATTVDDNSIRFVIDGQQVTPQISNAGGVTTATFQPATPLEWGSSHSGLVTYTIGGVAQSNTFNFTVRLGGLVVEAEDYDYESGKFQPDANIMPYLGGAYADLVAVHNVDYRQPGNEPSGNIYRTGETPNVPLGQPQDADTLDIERAGYDVTSNYAIGWAGEDWYNYTRTFTNGNYKVVAAQSHGDPAGSAVRQRLRFGVVTAGQGTQNQTVQMFGSYSAPASGGWGTDTLTQVMNNDREAVVALSGTQTIRVFVDEGDFDWFVLMPTTNPPPANSFIIEAEDFNFGSGQTKAEASVNPPAVTAAYDTLGAVAEVDYHVIGDVTDAGSDNYRTNELPHVPINRNNNTDRGMQNRGHFDVTVNYKIGWIDSGEWFNYTRTFPNGNYKVSAAISHGDAGPTSGSLQLVTAGATTTSQTVTPLGTFDQSGGTGGWGANRLVPLRDSSGNPAVVTLGGTQTVRYTAGSGDFDYLVFSPTTETGGGDRPMLSFAHSGTSLTITWTNGGSLEASDTLGATANWTAAGASSPVTVQTTGAARFFRVRK